MIAIDAQVLLWGIKKDATPNRAHMIGRAEHFLKELHKKSDRIMVPSQALQEFLVRYNDGDRASVLAIFERRFFVAPYDGRAAVIAAKMKADKEAWHASRSETGADKKCISADMIILATAIAHGAKKIVAEDDDLHNLAKHLDLTICVERLPDPTFGKLPGWEDLE